MGVEAKRFYHRLIEKIAEKRGDEVSVATNWLRTKLSFSLLRSSLLCIRGSRSHKVLDVVSFKDTDVKLAAHQSQV